MALMNNLKGGADLSKPSLSAGWIVPAFFGLLILGVITALAMFTLSKAKTVVPGMSTVTEGARTYMS